MRPKHINSIRFLLLTFILLGSFQVSAQIILEAPEPADNPNLGGNSPWTAICAGVGGFNQYYATIGWAGAPNAGNEFILELSDANGDFTNPIELARSSDDALVQNPGFEFAIPDNIRGEGYRLRTRSTDPVDTSPVSDAYSMYFLNFTSNIHISPNGDGTTPGSICSDNPVILTVDNVPDPDTYQYVWFRSGSQLTGETGPSITASASGMYFVFIDYGPNCSGSGNTDSNLVEVTVGGTGSGIGITTPSKTALCAGDTETLSIDMTGPWNYRWYKDGVIIPGATATTFTVDASISGFEGDYQVEISATGICTERSNPVTITNADSFTVTRNNPANIVVLPSQVETLSVSTTAVSPTYQWYRNNNILAGATNASLDITQEGTYFAEITQAGGTCPGTIKNSENTIAVVPSSFNIAIDYASTYTACENTSIVLQVATINAVANDGTETDVTAALVDSFTYQWQRNGADVAGETSKNISLTTIPENGDYIVNASLATNNESSNALTVQLLTSETVSISSTSTVYCSASDTIAISTTNDLTGESFAWERDGVSINTTDALLNVNEPGVYRLVLDKNGCSLSSNEITISPLDENLITLDVDGDIVFPEGSSRTVTASGGSSYRWLDANNTVMSTTDSMTFTQEGTFLLIANIDNCEISRPLTVIFQDLFNVPNVITPNGDGANDLWVIPNSFSNKQDVNVVIYDDRGIELLNVNGYANNWPQSSITFPKQNMVFYYVIKNASETLKQGTITVIR